MVCGMSASATSGFQPKLSTSVESAVKSFLARPVKLSEMNIDTRLVAPAWLMSGNLPYWYHTLNESVDDAMSSAATSVRLR